MTAVAPHKKPSLRALVVVVLACAVLGALGTWQVQRLAWKQELIATLQQQMAQPPLALDELAPPLPAHAWRPVAAVGRYDHAATVLLGPRTRKGVVGRNVLTPLVLRDGRRIMVNRGFVPMDTPLAVAAYTQPVGEVEVEGILRVPARGRFTPDNDPAQNLWYWPDLAAVLPQADMVRDVYIQQSPFVGADWPQAVVLSPDLPNNHAQYAAFWYVMAGLALAVYVLARRKGYA